MKTKKLKSHRKGGERVVIFHRYGGMWYPLELPHDEDLAVHADHNPGTAKITDALTGKTLWEPASPLT